MLTSTEIWDEKQSAIYREILKVSSIPSNKIQLSWALAKLLASIYIQDLH